MSISYFSTEELFVLTDILELPELFGFTELPYLRINALESIEIGIEKLKQKKLIQDEKKLTKAGMTLLKIIARYSESNHYLMVNKLYIMPDEVEAICLKKVEKGYQIKVAPNHTIVESLYKNYSIISRKPSENELQFQKQRLKRSEVRQLNLEDTVYNEELVTIGKVTHTETALEKEEWILFILEETLYAVHSSEGRVYLMSQYWLNKWLIDEFSISYELPEGVSI